MYREQAIMKPVETTSEYVVARYRRLHSYNDVTCHYLKFQYKFDYQWFWRTKIFELGWVGPYEMPSNDELEKKVVKWLELRTRSGSL